MLGTLSEMPNPAKREIYMCTDIKEIKEEKLLCHMKKALFT